MQAQWLLELLLPHWFSDYAPHARSTHAAQMSRAKASQTKAGQRQERQSLNLIGLSTAILSTVTAIAAMQGGYFANSAMLF